MDSSNGSNETDPFFVEWCGEDTVTRSEMRFIVKHNQLVRSEHRAGVLKWITLLEYGARVKRGAFKPQPIRFKPVVSWVRVKYSTLTDRARLVSS